jgi:hypothetical protein
LVINSPAKPGIPRRTNSTYSPGTKHRNLQLNEYILAFFVISEFDKETWVNVRLCIILVVSAYNKPCAKY